MGEHHDKHNCGCQKDEEPKKVEYTIEAITNTPIPSGESTWVLTIITDEDILENLKKAAPKFYFAADNSDDLSITGEVIEESQDIFRERQLRLTLTGSPRNRPRYIKIETNLSSVTTDAGVTFDIV